MCVITCFYSYVPFFCFSFHHTSNISNFLRRGKVTDKIRSHESLMNYRNLTQRGEEAIRVTETLLIVSIERIQRRRVPNFFLTYPYVNLTVKGNNCIHIRESQSQGHMRTIICITMFFLDWEIHSQNIKAGPANYHVID